MKKTWRLLATAGTMAASNLYLARVYAQDNGGSIFDDASQQGGNFSLSNLLSTIVSTILYVAGFIAIVYLIYNGIQYITSAGDETKATKAKTGIINAIIGILVIALAFAIARYLSGTAAGDISEGGTLS